MKQFNPQLVLTSIILIMALFSLPLMAQAEDAKLLGTHGDWKTYHFTEKGAKTCYALTKPKKIKPKKVKRGEIYFLVTNKKKAKVFNEISVITGYPYKKNSVTTANIDNRKFDMYTLQDGAWIDGAVKQKNMVAAMKKGSVMIIKGLSSRGTRTTDNYSLKGLTAALREINKACK